MIEFKQNIFVFCKNNSGGKFPQNASSIGQHYI